MANSLELLPKSETINLRERHIADACTLFYSLDPLKIVRGQGQYMYDEKNTEYLDCINNVAHVGHCHRDVVRAGQDQMATLATNSRFLHDNIVLCAQKLTSTFPGNLSVCFFVNSGSEANDLALRLARYHTGNKDIITVDHAYHGHLDSTIDISPYKFKKLKNGQKPYVHVAPCPDVYRGKYRNDAYKSEDLGTMYAEEVRSICDNLKRQGKGVSAFISESLMSVGGQILPPQDYYRQVYKHVREAGGLCIADEVQVGFGRVGTHMWAFQLYGEDLIPDIVTVGKPIGNGHPIAAVVTTPEIAKAYSNTGLEYFNTYGGNPVSCAIALAVMDVIEQEKLLHRALAVGNFLISKLQELATRRRLIGDVRGAGLFVGIELVVDRVTREPATTEANYVVYRMKDEKIILSREGPDYNILKLKPPMVFDFANAHLFVEKLDEILQEVEKPEQGVVPRLAVLKATITAVKMDNEAAIAANSTPTVCVKSS